MSPHPLAWIAGGGAAPQRIAIVVAHPDDETLGASLVLGRFPERVALLHVTDGAPRNMQDATAHGFASWQAYAEARRGELVEALAIAGIGPEQARCLDVPDQGAVRRLAPLAAEVGRFLAEVRADVVLTHAYEGGHPDHDSTAFAVAAALRPGDGGERPQLVEMPLYRADGERMAIGAFLPGGPEPLRLRLDDAARERKRRMMACFRTQQAVLAPFRVAEEAFRLAPRHDFTAPPHPGPLHYERFDWGATGESWRQAAAAALALLERGE